MKKKRRIKNRMIAAILCVAILFSQVQVAYAAGIESVAASTGETNEEPDTTEAETPDTNIETESTGNDKTTIAFKTNNKPGALLEILKIFLENNINLSYISSRQSKISEDEYIFIVNLDGHIKNPNVFQTIEEIKPITSFFRNLGSYQI